MDDLRAGVLEYSEGDYPRVFYSGPYDKDDIAKGLLRSPELVLVSVHVAAGAVADFIHRSGSTSIPRRLPTLGRVPHRTDMAWLHRTDICG